MGQKALEGFTRSMPQSGVQTTFGFGGEGADSTRFADPECLAFSFTIYTAIVRLQ